MKKKPEYPRISIITPSFNQGRFIKQTIDSILNQNYPNLEYWVVDGGSTDDTVDILKSYGKKINWVSEKDKGQTDAINKGLKRITGDIVAYLNSDDMYLPNTLHTVAEYFMNHADAQWLTGDYFIIDADGKKIQSYVAAYKTMLRRNPTFARLCIANFINQPSTFWSRTLIDEIGFLDEHLRYVMDFDYWMRIIQKYPLHVLPRHLSFFRIHDESKGGSQYGHQFAEEHETVKRYTGNGMLRFFHLIHASLIILAYKFIK